MASETVTTLDCEGACCCRCECCKGKGYWSDYSFTLPACNTVLGSGALQLNTATNWVLHLDTPIFGSSGGTGQCGASQGQIFFQSNGITLFGLANLFINIGGTASLLMEFTMGSPASGFYWDQSITWNCASFDCRTGSTFSYNSMTFTQIGWTFPSADYTGTTINISPWGSATYQQCGQNSDGSTYTGVVESAPPMMFSVAPSGKTTALPTIPHPDRCEFYGGRDEFRPGCNGWLCAGKCAKSISKCMPGVFCQTCTEYSADLDYIGQGPSGWFK